MKRSIVFVLLLCLVLAGCGLSPVVESSMEAPSLPVPEPPATKSEGIYWEITIPDPYSATVPKLQIREGFAPMVIGPAAEVPAMVFLGNSCSDPVYGDVDGDGERELVYRCPGPTSGLWTEAICVYGLEQGWPVLKGYSIFHLWMVADFGLEQGDGQALLRCTPQEWDEDSSCYVNKDTLRLPLTLAEGEVLVNGGELPEGILYWGTLEGSSPFGASFSALRQQVGDEDLLNEMYCIVWQRTVIRATDSASAGKAILQTCAALTDNSVTVTGFLVFEKQETGVACVVREGVELLPPVTDPEAFLGLTGMELTERLGKCHFTMGLGSLVSSSSAVTHLPSCWFTEDGKLLLVESNGTVEAVFLWDVTAGTPFLGSQLEVFTQEPDDADTVIVHQEINPTTVENAPLWERFLDAVAQGEECEVRLRMLYQAGEWDLTLRYDGEVFHLNDGAVGVYRYLIVDVEDDPPASAKFRRATHYLLSDDPDMTWQQYMARTLSSYAPPGEQLPAASGLFTVYE